MIARCSIAPSIICVAGLVVTCAHAQTAPSPRVESVSLVSAHPMPVVRVSEQMQPIHSLVERSIGHISEGPLLITAVTLGQRTYRIAPEQTQALTGGFKDVYARIAADPDFANVSTALSNAVSRDPNRAGHYFLHRPARLTPDTQAIVFLHGFGGNFQFYTYLLKEAFPEHIVIAPSYGIAWRDAGLPFLREVLDDVERRLETKLANPWLIAISAGGPAGFAAYAEAPRRFRGLVCLASCPRADQLHTLPHDANILMINGTSDEGCPISLVQDLVRPHLRGMPSFRMKEIDSDHFFLLTRTDETFALIREFMDGSQVAPGEPGG